MAGFSDNDWAEFAAYDENTEHRDKAALLSEAWHEGYNDFEENRESAFQLIFAVDTEYAYEYGNGYCAARDDCEARRDRDERNELEG